jgi:hypothetical protein
MQFPHVPAQLLDLWLGGAEDGWTGELPAGAAADAPPPDMSADVEKRDAVVAAFKVRSGACRGGRVRRY